MAVGDVLKITGTNLYEFAPPSGAWTAYTPSWTALTTNPSLGNGTLTGRYRLDGKTLYLTIYLSIGSTTTTGTGAWRFSLPTGTAKSWFGGTGKCWDNSAGASYAAAVAISGSSSTLSVEGAGGVWQSTFPFAWAQDDNATCTIVLEIN